MLADSNYVAVKSSNYYLQLLVSEIHQIERATPSNEGQMELSQHTLNGNEENKQIRGTEDKNLNLERCYERLVGKQVI